MTTEPATTEDLIETMARGMELAAFAAWERERAFCEGNGESRNEAEKFADWAVPAVPEAFRKARAALSAMRERGWEPVKQGASADADRALALRAEPPAASPSLRDCDPSRAAADVEAIIFGLLKGEHSNATIGFNDDNGPNYTTVAEVVELWPDGAEDWVSEEEMRRAIGTNRMWTLQWYPETPVGFCRLRASTLAALLAACPSASAIEAPQGRRDAEGGSTEGESAVPRQRETPEWQPEDTTSLAEAIREIETRLPGWWWTTGACSVSRHASCGPDRKGPSAHLCETPMFGNGFDADLAEGSCADALRDVMQQGLAALAGHTEGGE